MDLIKVKWYRYRPGVAQRVGRGISPLFHDRGTRRVWVVSSTHRPHFFPGKDSVTILQEAGWAPGPVWTGGKSRPHRDSIPNRPGRSQSLCRLSYRKHNGSNTYLKTLKFWFSYRPSRCVMVLNKKLSSQNSVVLVRTRTIPTERPPPLGESKHNNIFSTVQFATCLGYSNHHQADIAVHGHGMFSATVWDHILFIFVV